MCESTRTGRHNAQSMVTGKCYNVDLDDLATAFEQGFSFKTPMNEVAYHETRLFLEVDGEYTTEMEDSLINVLIRMNYSVDAWVADKAVLRSNGRYHITYYNVVMPIPEYHSLVKEMGAMYPAIDCTCNKQKAWLRFPMTPKKDSNRKYHLVQGTYRQAFINRPSMGQVPPKVIRTQVGATDRDVARIKLVDPTVRLAKKAFIDKQDSAVRVYWTVGKAWCHMREGYHTKRPLYYRVHDDWIEQGCCDVVCCGKKVVQGAK